MVGHFHAAPALQRREDHEEIGDAVALVFVVVTSGSSGLGRDRGARLGDQLLGGLVQTHERTIGITRPLVGFQHVFHGGDEARIGFGRDHPLPLAVRFKDVFLTSADRIVARLLDDVQFDDFSSSRRRVQRANPSGAGEQARAISFASAAPSNIRGRAELGLNFGSASPQTPPRPSADACERHC